MATKGHAINPIEISVENREEVIKEYAPMIKYVANRIAMRLPPHIEVDDLISVGVLGLIDAIDNMMHHVVLSLKPMLSSGCAGLFLMN